MRGAFVLAIDQGTTGSRTILYDKNARIISSSYQEFPQFFPNPGWVEHNPEIIWRSVSQVAKTVFKKTHIDSSQIASLGITNQRETTVVWNRLSGKPIYPAIVWQDRRTSEECERLKALGAETSVRKKTGLVLDPYFSATKIAWILDHVKGARKAALRGELLFGTMDTWLIWKLTGGKVHATDPTNASRTLLFDIYKKQWDPALLKIFRIPASLLPRVFSSGDNFGITAQSSALPAGITIHSVMGDQQAALYGQSCYSKGSSKNTYGTGCFAVMNLGSGNPGNFPAGLLGTLACGQKGESVFALEGSIFMGGAVIQWLRDGLKLIRKAGETEAMAKKVNSNGGVTVIPALTGLGSPYWDPKARGMISGITRGIQKEHIVRASLESIAQQSADVIETMSKKAKITELKVDGGATRNRFLMQFQADLLGFPVSVAHEAEFTAWGTAKLAGRAAGLWDFSKRFPQAERYEKFSPKMKRREAKRLRDIWKKEIQRVRF